jgi:hypothetical protein
MKKRLRELVREGRDIELLALHKTLLERTYGAPNQRVESVVTLAQLLGEGEDDA